MAKVLHPLLKNMLEKLYVRRELDRHARQRKTAQDRRARQIAWRKSAFARKAAMPWVNAYRRPVMFQLHKWLQ